MRVVTMTLVAAMLAAVGVSATHGHADLVAQFELFKKTHKRTYTSPSEEAKRLGFFIRNMQKAAKLQETNPLAKFGANEFADMSEEEFKTRHNAEGHFRAAVKSRKARKPVAAKASAAFAQSMDWRTKGVVTGVKNQGQCGSCWSFSTTGNIEGQWAKAGHSLVSLSEQELVSCDTTCNGCNGGLMDLAFEWLVNARGGAITSEAQYPYVSGGGSAPGCDMSGKTAAAYISGHHDVAHSENAMAQWMSTGGPLSIGVDASSWQTYMGGILSDCTSSQVDHGVLAVGYDLSGSTPYWIIKNSWGASWGESGYIRVAYGSNQCLITTAPSSSIVSGNTPPVPPPGPPAPSNSGSGSASSSSGVGPSPPAPPSSGTFTQSICPYVMCLSGCTSNTFATGTCLQLQGGGSVIAECGVSNLNLQVYTSSDCSGAATTSQQPLNSCVEDTSGTYLYNQCSQASAKALLPRANVTIAKRRS